MYYFIINPKSRSGEGKILWKQLKKILDSKKVDYQTFITKPFRESYDKILSIFIIPAGHNYNEGYDILDVQKMIRENMNWVNIQSLLNFILVKYVKSYMRIQAYLTKKIRKEKNQIKRDTLMKKLETMIQAKNQLVNLACSASCA